MGKCQVLVIKIIMKNNKIYMGLFVQCVLMGLKKVKIKQNVFHLMNNKSYQIVIVSFKILKKIMLI